MQHAGYLGNASGVFARGSRDRFADAFHLLSKPEYSPRRSLYLAHPVLLWTNVLLDVLTTSAYFLFFFAIWWLIRKLRKFPQLKSYIWALRTFQVFLLASGIAILIRTINIWLPLYQISICVKIVCAAASTPTAVLFIWQLPLLSAEMTRFFDLRKDEKKQSEALRKSEQLLDRTNTLAGVGGWEVDLSNNQVSWSAETCRIHGFAEGYVPTLEEGIAFYTPECRPIITEAVKNACAGKGGFDLELSIVRRDGNRIWVRAVGAADFANGAPVRLSGAFQDINNRVVERTALKEANERVVLATDSGKIGIWDWDVIRGVVHCDRWTHHLHGIEWKDGEANDLRWRKQMHPEDRGSVVQALQDAIDDIKPYDVEFRVIWPDGSIHNIRATGKVERDASHRALRMVGANWDVTEARSLSAQLAAQHELLRVTLQSIGDGVITTDAQACIVWLNPVAERMTGWTSDEAKGQEISDIFKIVHAETRLTVTNPVKACLAEKRTVRLTPNTLLIGRHSTEFGIDDSAAPILGQGGALLGAVLVFHDVTEQRLLMAEAHRATKMELRLKGEFLSHVSHELRSPLTSIYSFTSIIMDNLAGETTLQQQNYLQIILKNVDQLQGMIEDLLTVTQANEGKLRIIPSDVSIVTAVEDAVHTIQTAATNKDILITVGAEESVTHAHTDPLRLRQILIILLDNAVKFTPQGGRIGIRTTKQNDEILFEVSDTGCGIPYDKQTRVFEQLYQVTGSDQPDTSSNGRNGLGLGLHIARDLVMRQGGRIWITDAPTQGSIFYFTLPVASGDLLLDPPSEFSERSLLI